MKTVSLPSPGRRARTILLEALIVGALGGLVAFALNALSPRGLKLTRDYFPGAVVSPVKATNVVPPIVLSSGTNTPVLSVVELAAARLKAKDLKMVERPQLQQLFHDLRYAQGQVVFVDARDVTHYQAGHIPGAHHFDHYRAEQYLAAVLPVCFAAEQIVVYCNGGDCEDSEFAAFTLREAGVPNEKLFVYVGGFTDWSTNGLPVELGARGGGNLGENRP